ncbi:MAG: LPS-assembly protein LptD [Alloprevotella sp.]|nr:LPS-assembly protein LptD [Alloprevotella sp.]
MRKTILFFIVSFALLSLAAMKPAAGTKQPAQAAQHHGAQGRVDDDSLKADTSRLILPADSAWAPDDTLKADTARIDTLKLTTKKSSIEDPVDYTAEDSLVYDADTRLVQLYGKATVKYQDMTLDAGQISLDMDSSLVHATFFADTTDTTGLAKNQLPVYRQQGDEYESEQMSFNFKSKKGFIHNVSTTQGNGFVKSTSSKRTDDGTLYLQDATYTTCDAEHPHFFLKLTRAKVNPGRETVFGPAYLVVADVPTPIAIPYGFFPFNKKYSSGFVMPSYGDETSRGFYLRDGGYYFAINDYLDLKVLGEIYTKGSWGVSLESNYRKRYKYSGNIFFSYINTVEGEKNMPDYLKTKSLKVQWTHTKDASAGGNTTFTARVNFASENYERKNLSSLYNPLSYSQSTRASSISFGHNFPDWGLSISGSANLTQNMRDTTLTVTLPELSWNLTRRYPFRRKRQVGKERWYEKISLSYSGQLSNSIHTKEDQLLHSNLIKDWRNGMQHRFTTDATFQVFKYINVTPTFSLRDLMYTNRIMRSWDEERQVERRDTTYGFYNLYDWNIGVSANTTLYGFYKPWKKLFGDKIDAIRHVFKPSISFSYAPDFTSASYGYTRHYEKVDAYGNRETVTYSPYERGLYGYPTGTLQGMVTMSVSNNLEMRIKSDKDSTGFKKISLIDELYGSISYNFAAKTRPWSDLSMRLRLKLSKNYTFSMSAIFATYAYKFNDQGQVVTSDRTEWSYGRFGRFQGLSQNLHYTFNNQTFSKFLALFSRDKKKPKAKEEETSDDTEVDTEDANVDPDLIAAKRSKGKKTEKAKVDKDGYKVFSIPWSVTLSYGITMYENRRKPINPVTMRYPYGFTQTLNATGYIRIADGWNISFTSGYDFEYHKISMTTASISRDLHCFEMSASVVLRPYTSFNFTFRARANELTDALKWDKRSSYSSNIEWY